MAEQRFDAVPVVSALIARQLTTALLNRDVCPQRVRDQVETLGLQRNAVPDVCCAWNRGNLEVPVQGVTSTVSCRLEVSFVNTYAEAIEAASWDRLLVSLRRRPQRGIPALGHLLRERDQQ
eukprot:6313257-Amphidinium_carterae.1